MSDIQIITDFLDGTFSFMTRLYNNCTILLSNSRSKVERNVVKYIFKFIRSYMHGYGSLQAGTI